MSLPHSIAFCAVCCTVGVQKVVTAISGHSVQPAHRLPRSVQTREVLLFFIKY